MHDRLDLAIVSYTMFRFDRLNDLFFQLYRLIWLHNLKKHNQLNLQLKLKLITVVIARGTTEENNTRNFCNPVRPMLTTFGELRIALRFTLVNIHRYNICTLFNYMTI